ncbi:MAG: septation protein A [Candidatus Protistobacter heckmanni]|nr:septation protein A [Candidatus Protistobacter heckmanni]
MKFLFDLFPVILFFVAYKMADIYVATVAAIAATLVQIVWVWLRHRKVDAMLWVSLVLVGGFGGATLFLHNETFIKWKPSVFYWVLAAALLVSATVFRKNLIRAAMVQHIKLEDWIWGQLNLAWAVFFALLGVLNLWVALNFPTDVWVSFKLFGASGLTVTFVIVQAFWLGKHALHEEDDGAKLTQPELAPGKQDAGGHS